MGQGELTNVSESYNYHRGNYEQIRIKLAAICWDEKFTGKNVDEIWIIFWDELISNRNMFIRKRAVYIAWCMMTKIITNFSVKKNWQTCILLIATLFETIIFRWLFIDNYVSSTTTYSDCSRSRHSSFYSLSPKINGKRRR